MSSETSNSLCQRRRSPRRRDHSINKVSNHQSQEVDSAVLVVEEEEASAAEEEVVALEAAEELLAVVQEEVASAVVEAEVDIEFICLN